MVDLKSEAPQNHAVEQKQEFKVAIRYQEHKALPFKKLQSRNAVAIVFSYVGCREEVSDIM